MHTSATISKEDEGEDRETEARFGTSEREERNRGGGLLLRGCHGKEFFLFRFWELYVEEGARREDSEGRLWSWKRAARRERPGSV